MYFWNGSVWNQRGSGINVRGVSASNPNSLFLGSSWGHSVALSSDGQSVVVGNSHGLVSVYHWDGSDWDQAGNFINGSSEVVIGFSVSISCDGKTIAFGTMLSNNDVQVHVYSWDGVTWNQVGSAITREDTRILYTQSVSLSCDGKTVGFGAGYVRVFTWNGDVWSQVGVNIKGSASGYSISLSSHGSKVVVAEHEHYDMTDGVSSAAATRIYSIPTCKDLP